MVKKTILVLALVFLSAVAGCAATQDLNRPMSRDEAAKLLAEESLSDLETAYQSRDTQQFMTMVEKDYAGYLGFEESLNKYFVDHSQLQLYFVVDSCLVSDKKITARVHWYKKVQFKSSSMINKYSGQAQLTFNINDGHMRLLSLSGANPFF